MGRDKRVLKLSRKKAFLLIMLAVMILVAASVIITKGIKESRYKKLEGLRIEQLKNHLMEEAYGQGWGDMEGSGALQRPYVSIRVENNGDPINSESWTFIVTFRSAPQEEVRYGYSWKYDGVHDFFDHLPLLSRTRPLSRSHHG